MTKKKAKITALNEKEGVSQPKSLSEKVASTLKKRRKKVPSANDLIKGILKKDKTSLSRAITLVENNRNLLTLCKQIDKDRNNWCTWSR